MRPPVDAFVALGANLGDSVASVRRATQELASALGQTETLGVSPLYTSPPFQAEGPDYVNAVMKLRTRLTAPDLLAGLLRFERAAGRVRPFHHAPRVLDLDLLLYGDARIDSPQLTLPHPRMAERAFVQAPLSDLDPARSVQAARLQDLMRAQGVRRLCG